MDDETQPVVHLEVTVPRIAFFAGTDSPQSVKTDDAHTIEHQQEQVQVLVPEQEERRFASRNIATAGQIAGEPVMYGSAAGAFRLFQLRNIPHRGQKLLLQVLRHLTGTTGHLSLTAEQAFSLEFRQLDSSTQREEQATTSPSQAIPGLNRIVIYLDKDGAAVNVSIDGAES